MKTFEEFKASREKIDATTRKMSLEQWQQAYDAYRRSRERVRPNRSSASSQNSKSSSGRVASRGSRSGKSASGSARTHGKPTPSSSGKSAALRVRVRQESAYAELRIMVNVLAWGVVGVAVLNVLLKLAFYTSVESGVLAVGSGVMQVVFALILKSMVQVIIDIPDIALYCAANQPSSVQTSSADTGASDA